MEQFVDRIRIVVYVLYPSMALFPMFGLTYDFDWEGTGTALVFPTIFTLWMWVLLLFL